MFNNSVKNSIVPRAVFCTANIYLMVMARQTLCRILRKDYLMQPLKTQWGRLYYPPRFKLTAGETETL